MKEKSHRVSEACEKKVDKTFLRTRMRRLDGDSLYTATGLQVRHACGGHPGRAPKNNPRFVVTNLPHTPEHVYTLYRARGDVENRIKELKAGLALDRLSCSRFLANQFRLLPWSRRCGVTPPGRRVPRRKRPRCATGSSRSPSGSNARSDHRPAFSRVVSMAADLAPARPRRRRHVLTRSIRANRPGKGTPVTSSSHLVPAI